MKNAVFFISMLWALNSVAREPIVFVHGLGVPSVVYQVPFQLTKLLKKLGYEAYVVNTPAVTTVEKAQAIAARDIVRLLGHRRFHLVGHSQGGLTSRAIAHRPEFKGKVISVTTLSTPNHGAEIADELWRVLVLHQGQAPDWAAKAFQDIFHNQIDVLRELTSEQITGKFNSKYTDVEGVRYFSMGFFIPSPGWRFASLPILSSMADWVEQLGGGANDGLVSVASALWGESLGDIPGDHWAESFPVPFAGKVMVDDVFKRVTDNLDVFWP